MAGRLFRMLSILVVVCGVRSAAQAAPDDQEVVPEPAAQQQQFFGGIDDNNFDQWVFQTAGGNQKLARDRLQTRVKLQVDELDAACGLTDAQKKKLQLAAQGDTKRFFDEVQTVRLKFQAAKKDQNAFNQIWQEISPLQQKMTTGLYGETSFFAKTLRGMLTSEQQAKYQVILDERRAYRFKAAIATSLLTLEKAVPMKHAQHEELKKMLLENLQPPATFGQYDHYVVLYHLSKIPEEKIKPVFDDRQWDALQAQFRQARGMEQFLVQNGLIPAQPPVNLLLKMKKPQPGNEAQPKKDDPK